MAEAGEASLLHLGEPLEESSHQYEEVPVMEHLPLKTTSEASRDAVWQLPFALAVAALAEAAARTLAAAVQLAAATAALAGIDVAAAKKLQRLGTVSSQAVFWHHYQLHFHLRLWTLLFHLVASTLLSYMAT